MLPQYSNQRICPKKKWIFKQSAAPTLATLAGAANGRIGRWRRVGLLGPVSGQCLVLFEWEVGDGNLCEFGVKLKDLCTSGVQTYIYYSFGNTPPNSEIICGRNVSTKVVCGIILFFEKKAMLKIWKKSWVPFRSYLLNSTANPAHLHSNWVGLAGLFSR